MGYFGLPATHTTYFLRLNMNILTLETTCDETAAAIVTERREVLGSVVASQDELHRRFGGVVPEIASRAHVERILPVIDEALRKANLTLKDIDAVAVANTPGLAGSLLVGLAAAKSLCVALGVPLVAINHLQAHIYACRMAAGGGSLSVRGPDRQRRAYEFVPLPRRRWISNCWAATIDDAAGEAFDKVAAHAGLAVSRRTVDPAGGRGGRSEGVQFSAIVAPRRGAARFQFQRAENGGPLSSSSGRASPI